MAQVLPAVHIVYLVLTRFYIAGAEVLCRQTNQFVISIVPDDRITC